MVKIPCLQNYTLQYLELKFSHNMPDKFVNFKKKSIIFPDCMGIQLWRMKFYSSMWARKITKCLHISSFSYIYLNAETPLFFITGSPWDREKVLLFWELACVASCLWTLILFIVKDTLWLCAIRFLAKFELTTRVSNKTCLKSSKNLI